MSRCSSGQRELRQLPLDRARNRRSSAFEADSRPLETGPGVGVGGGGIEAPECSLGSQATVDRATVDRATVDRATSVGWLTDSMPKGHAVVDGSNLATEGRSEPSLAQLDEAVAAFEVDHDFSHVTVVVDASFEHRVTARERAAANRAIDDGRIITPPAGVVGRGDTFILQIADRARAVVVSNDSFQEFHGQFEWLFDEGRLIGGKPVRHVGWVFVPRVPVRGPTSRKAVRDARTEGDGSSKKKRVAKATATKKAVTEKAVTKRRAKKTGSKPTGTKKAAAKNTAPPDKATAKKTAAPDKATAKKTAAPDKAARKAGTRQSVKKAANRQPVMKTGSKATGTKKATAKLRQRDDGVRAGENPVRAWRRFRHEHPVGTTVVATVERFSSHGAYAVTADGLSAYIPSRLLSDPPPSRARDVVAEGESRQFVVHEYHEEDRGVDLGLLPHDGKATKPPAKKAGTEKATAKKVATTESTAKSTGRTRKRRSSKRSSSRR